MVFHSKKKEKLTDGEKEAGEIDREIADEQGDRWSFVAVLPDTGFIHAIHHGKRTQDEAEFFLEMVKRRSDGEAPLFVSDAWFYESALYKVYGRYECPPYKGRGPYPSPRWIPDEKLKYAQVYKKRDKKGNIESITTRVIKGDEAKILAIIREKGRSYCINTSFVESRNGKYRKDNVRLSRATLCHSKKSKNHDAQADLLTAFFNYCTENSALKKVINPNAKLFEVKFLRQSPAMVEGLTDKILTMKELLCCRVPKLIIP